MATDPAYDGDSAPSVPGLLDEQVTTLRAVLLELGTDAEGAVHDARVALRRLRSSLAVHSCSLPDAEARLLSRELRWLAGELGPARDAQVLLGRIRAAIAVVGQGDPSAEDLLATFEREKRASFRAARATLASARFAALLVELEAVRHQALGTHDEQATQGSERSLRRLVRDLRRAAGATDEQLHELRKTVKRLRYARGGHDDLEEALKRVQAALGEHHDSVVARSRLAAHNVTPLVQRLLDHEVRASEEALALLGPAVERLRARVA